MLERWAKREKVYLKIKFWNDAQFKRRFYEQVVAANALLKLYPEKAMFNAVARKELLWCYSLRSPKVKAVILEEAAKLEKLEIKDRAGEFNSDTELAQVFGKSWAKKFKNNLEGL